MKKVIAGLVILGAVGIGWYALSPLFKNTTVDDALPATQTTGVPGEEQLSEEVDRGATPITESVSAPVSIVDTPLHPATGMVRIVKGADGTYVRYENYKTINGPDVRVYLANDLKATHFVDLGPIKGTEGNINYRVSDGVNIDEYRYVLTWCEDFSVLFNSADLSAIR